MSQYSSLPQNQCVSFLPTAFAASQPAEILRQERMMLQLLRATKRSARIGSSEFHMTLVINLVVLIHLAMALLKTGYPKKKLLVIGMKSKTKYVSPHGPSLQAISLIASHSRHLSRSCSLSSANPQLPCPSKPSWFQAPKKIPKAKRHQLPLPLLKQNPLHKMKFKMLPNNYIILKMIPTTPTATAPAIPVIRLSRTTSPSCSAFRLQALGAA